MFFKVSDFLSHGLHGSHGSHVALHSGYSTKKEALLNLYFIDNGSSLRDLPLVEKGSAVLHALVNTTKPTVKQPESLLSG